MINSNKILVLTVLATLAIAIKAEQLTNVEKYVVEKTPPEAAMLTQLITNETNSPGDRKSYKCTAGSKRSNRITCSAHDKSSWSTPHDVELTLRCPKSGFGDIISFVEILFETTSSSVNCVVSDGAIGANHIAIRINTWKTLIFDYAAKFYTN